MFSSFVSVQALCLAVLSLLASSAALAADTVSAARLGNAAVLAATCANCHGPDGRSPGGIPSLRGLPAEYLQQRLEAFNAGTAPDATVMTRLMKGYDEAQIRDLAHWFAASGKQEGK